MIKKINVLVLVVCFLLTGLGIYPANLQTTVKAAVSTYSVSGTQILKDGQPFLVKGINVSGPNSFWPENVTNDANKIVDVWKFNTIRVVCRLTGGYPNDSLTDIVNTFTAKGAVVMIEIHDFTGKYPDSTQQSTLNNWWVNVANQFKGNSAVWFNIMNEPGGSAAVDATWRNSHESAIKAIRNTGANNIIICDDHGWAQAKGGTNSGVLRDGQYLKNTYGNIAFNIHTYQDWKKDNGQDLLNTYFNSTDAKSLCVFFGEYGVDTGYDSSHLYDCANTVTNTFEVAKARNIGRIGWHWFGGDKNDLTKSGNGNGNLIDKTDGSRPTNLTFLGGMAWDDNHNITTGPAPNNGDKYEVENGYISTRGVSKQTSITGYSGTGYVGSFSSTFVSEWGSSTQYFAQVTMEVNASSAGSTPITFRYHNNSGSSKTLSVYVNGRDKGQVTFSSNSSWADKVQNFDLRQGKNVITIWQDSSSDTGAVNLDYIKIGPGTPPSDTQVPTAPTLSVSGRTTSSISLSWTAASDNVGVIGYDVYRGTTKLTTTSSTTTSYINTGLSEGTTYTYKVTAKDAAGNTKDSNSVTAATDTSGTQTITSVNDTAFVYSGTWNTSTGTGKYMSNDHYSSSTGAYYTSTFTGNQVKIYAAVASHHGKAGVSIDGGAEVIVDFYSATRAEQALVWTSPVLTEGQHTIKVRVSGTKNSSSTGYTIPADRLDVYSNPQPDTQAPTAPTLSVSGRTTSSISLSWTAATDNVGVIGYDVYRGTTKLTTTTSTNYTNTGLSEGTTYTYKVTAKDAAGNTKDSNSVTAATDTIITPTITSVNDTTFVYSGTWNTSTGTGKYMSNDHYSSSTGAYYTSIFTGNQVKIYAAVASHHGKAGVSIDGGTETVVDFYSATRAEQALVWTSPVLTAGQHTIRVRVLGTKNSSSTGYTIPADRLDIYSNANTTDSGTTPIQWQPSNPNASQKTKDVLNYLYSIEGKYMLSGQMGEKWNTDNTIDYVYSKTGKYPAVYGIDLTFDDSDRYDAMTECINQWNKGSLIHVSWHAVQPNVPESGGWDAMHNGTIDSAIIDQMLTPGTSYYNEWMRRLDVIAGHLKRLRDNGVVVLWRPFHEMNGGWFWWGKQPRFKEMWIQMYDRFTNYHDLDNLLWVYSPNYLYDPNKVYSYDSMYPGDGYVDLLALDIYINYAHKYSKSHYDALKAVGNGKPVGIGENGDIPSVSNFLNEGQNWVWWMTWNGFEYQYANTDAWYTKIYSDPKTLTQEEVNLP